MSMSSLENVSHNSKSILSKFSTLYSFSLTTLIRVIKSHHLSRFICKKLVDYIGDGAPPPLNGHDTVFSQIYCMLNALNPTKLYKFISSKPSPDHKEK